MSWVGEEPGLDNVKRMLGRWKPIALEITFLEPLTDDALESRKTIAAAARAAIAAKLGVA
jgi:1-acyl-sn-glycerol-3-phosphate acyltransferase